MYIILCIKSHKGLWNAAMFGDTIIKVISHVKFSRIKSGINWKLICNCTRLIAIKFFILFPSLYIMQVVYSISCREYIVCYLGSIQCIMQGVYSILCSKYVVYHVVSLQHTQISMIVYHVGCIQLSCRQYVVYYAGSVQYIMQVIYSILCRQI